MPALWPVPSSGLPSNARIAVMHCGAVGLGTAILLARHHQVVIADSDPERVHQVNAGCSPLDEPDMTAQLQHESLRLRATTSWEDALEQADFTIVTTPTHYDPMFGSVDTRALDECLEAVQRLNPQTVVAISSNLPVGYTRRHNLCSDASPAIVAPVVLRPGCAYQDRTRPARLVIGERSMRAAKLAWLLRDSLCDGSLPVVFTHATEAEAIYLFEQKRLLQGGELSYAEVARYATRHGLDLGQLLEGLDLDGLPELAYVRFPAPGQWIELPAPAAAA